MIDLERIEWRRGEVRRLTRHGYSASRIAAAIGVAERTVVRDRVAIGVAQRRPELISEAVWERVEKLMAGGCSCAEAARTVGISKHAVAHRFPDHKWTRAQTAEWARFMREVRRAS
ncbi:hypothetical protein [Williamsia serinedens]|uniref:Uncharacterized protein n=1 Tax=Williamsia serinedens TaxID=391736 RepID=A0ABT1H694_9NOCA|nr:hypothetical protein [Williamsia serinedens]MCP2162686.1 hypothetical protein [Williamsia serinedens]